MIYQPGSLIFTGVVMPLNFNEFPNAPTSRDDIKMSVLTGEDIFIFGLENTLVDFLNKACQVDDCFTDAFYHNRIASKRSYTLTALAERKAREFHLLLTQEALVSVMSVEYYQDGGNHYAAIADVFTLPEYRRQGLAKFNMQLTLAFLTARGIIPTLSVFTENKIAVQFYESLGFKAQRYIMSC